jgi:hypothetical protein
MCHKGILVINICNVSYYFSILCCLSSVFYLFQAIKAATDKESELPHLSGMAVVTLEGKAF